MCVNIHIRNRARVVGRSITTIARAVLRLRVLFGNDFHPMVLNRLKGLQPDFRQQLESVRSRFAARHRLFPPTSACLPACLLAAPLRVRLSETQEGIFARENERSEFVDKGVNSYFLGTASGSHWRFILQVAFARNWPAASTVEGSVTSIARDKGFSIRKGRNNLHRLDRETRKCDRRNADPPRVRNFCAYATRSSSEKSAGSPN